MVAIIGAVLFGLAIVFKLVGYALGPIDVVLLQLLGLLCVALHLAGVGTSARSGGWRRSRR